jgi:hypothetical protein
MLIGAVLFVASSWAQTDGPADLPTIRSGAIEIGVAGALATVEGIVNASLDGRGGYFRDGLGGLLGAEIVASYRHLSSLDAFGLEGAVSWQRRAGRSGNYPFVTVGGGIRHEMVGSFGQSRYPLGFGVGLRSLFGQRAAVRVQYQFRQILNDPVADFSEHRLVLGLSIFVRNGSR